MKAVTIIFTLSQYSAHDSIMIPDKIREYSNVGVHKFGGLNGVRNNLYADILWRIPLACVASHSVLERLFT